MKGITGERARVGEQVKSFSPVPNFQCSFLRHHKGPSELSYLTENPNLVLFEPTELLLPPMAPASASLGLRPEHLGVQPTGGAFQHRARMGKSIAQDLHFRYPHAASVASD